MNRNFRKQSKQKKNYRMRNVPMGQDFNTGNMNAEYLQIQHNMAANQRLYHGTPPLLPMPMVSITSYFNQWQLFSSVHGIGPLGPMVHGVWVTPQQANPAEGNSSLDSSPNSSFSPNCSSSLRSSPDTSKKMLNPNATEFIPGLFIYHTCATNRRS